MYARPGCTNFIGCTGRQSNCRTRAASCAIQHATISSDEEWAVVERGILWNPTYDPLAVMANGGMENQNDIRTATGEPMDAVPLVEEERGVRTGRGVYPPTSQALM